MAYLSAISSFWEYTLLTVKHQVYFHTMYNTDRGTQSEILFFSFSLVGGQVLNLCAYPHEYFTKGCALPRARRHKSFLRHCCVALLQDVIRRLCKKISLTTVHSTPRVAARMNDVTRCREWHRNRKVTSGKTGRDSGSFSMLEYFADSWPSNSVQNLRILYPHVTLQ